MDEYLREMLNSAQDNLNIFCGGDTKEINKILKKLTFGKFQIKEN